MPVIYFGGYVSFLSCVSGYPLTVFSGGRICAVDIMSHIQLVRSRPSPNEFIISELYPNFCLLAVRSSCSRWAFFSRLLTIAKCAEFLPSLMALADICSSLCLNSVSDMTAANIVTVDAGGVLRFPPTYSVDEYVCRWCGRVDARRFSIFSTVSTLTVTTARSELDTAYAGCRRRWKHCGERSAEDDHNHD